MQLHTQTNQPITLTDLLGQGGEAQVYNVADQPDVVAKLYHQPTPTHAAKLIAMLSQPPSQPNSHTAIAWPTQILLDAQQLVVGFLMPKVAQTVSIFNLYNPIMRRSLPYDCSWQMLHRIAFNLVTAVGYIHERGCVIGDMNESNILVNPQALVTLIDTDSFQLVDEHGMVHRCAVGKPEYTPPELQGVSLKQVTQTIEHDRFRVAVLLFQLLMNGFHPFAGIISTTHSVGRIDLYAIRQGLFPFLRPGDSLPPPHAPPFSMLHPELQATFRRCFVVGHSQPEARPTIADWQTALQTAEQTLQTCEVNRQHRYSSHQAQCPWCELEHRRLTPLKQALPQEAALQRLYAEALEAYHRADAETVMAKMNHLIKAGSPPADAYAYRGWASYRQGAYQAAVADSYRALSQEPNNVTAHYVMGLTRIAQDDYEAAVSSFSKAVATDQVSQQPRVLYERARAYKAMARHQMALKDLEQYQLLETDSQWLARGKSEKQLIEAALDTLDAISRNAGKPIGWMRRNYFGVFLGIVMGGVLYYQLGLTPFGVSLGLFRLMVAVGIAGGILGLCQVKPLRQKLPQFQLVGWWPFITAASAATGILMSRLILWVEGVSIEALLADSGRGFIAIMTMSLTIGITQAAILSKNYTGVWGWIAATVLGLSFIILCVVSVSGGCCGLIFTIFLYIFVTEVAFYNLHPKPFPLTKGYRP